MPDTDPKEQQIKLSLVETPEGRTFFQEIAFDLLDDLGIEPSQTDKVIGRFFQDAEHFDQAARYEPSPAAGMSELGAGDLAPVVAMILPALLHAMAVVLTKVGDKSLDKAVDIGFEQLRKRFEARKPAAYLEVNWLSDNVDYYKIISDTVRIGCGSDSHVDVTKALGESGPKECAEIRCDKGFRVVHREAEGGTFVNDKPITGTEPEPLRDGDIIRIVGATPERCVNIVLRLNFMPPKAPMDRKTLRRMKRRLYHVCREYHLSKEICQTLRQRLMEGLE